MPHLAHKGGEHCTWAERGHLVPRTGPARVRSMGARRMAIEPNWNGPSMEMASTSGSRTVASPITWRRSCHRSPLNACLSARRGTPRRELRYQSTTRS